MCLSRKDLLLFSVSCDCSIASRSEMRARPRVRATELVAPFPSDQTWYESKVQKVPFTGSSSFMISRLVSLSLPSTGSSFIMISWFVSLCLPSTGSCFVMLSSSPSWMFVSLRFPCKFLVQGSNFNMVWRRVLLCLPLYIFWQGHGLKSK